MLLENLLRVIVVKDVFFDVNVDILMDESFLKKVEEIVKEVLDLKVSG